MLTELFDDYVALGERYGIILGDGRIIFARGRGSILVRFNGESSRPIRLQGVLHVPDLGKNLLSVKAMDRNGASVLFKGGQCRIHLSGRLLGVGTSHGDRLYTIPVNPLEQARVALDGHSAKLWHNRFGHLGMDVVKRLAIGGVVAGVQNLAPPNEPCDGCAKGKQHRQPFPRSETCSTELLMVVHSDVCGPLDALSLGGSRYFVTFIDDKSRYVHIRFLKKKSEVLDRFREYVELVENGTGMRVKTLRSDNGGEYTSHEFAQFCMQRGIAVQHSIPHTPQQNGVSERMNRTLVEAARSMLHHANMPKSFWAEAVCAAVYLRNRAPTSTLQGKTPYEIWFNEKPDVSNLRVFGCCAMVHVPKEHRRKLDSKSLKVIFIGYSEVSKGYKFFDPATKKTLRSRDVRFVENEFWPDFSAADFRTSSVTPATGEQAVRFEVSGVEDSDQGGDIGDDHNHGIDDDHNYVDADDQPADDDDAVVDAAEPAVHPTYEQTFRDQVDALPAARVRRPPDRLVYAMRAENLTAEIDESVTIRQAWSGEYGQQWRAATDSEYESLMKTGTWELVPLPEGKNVVGSKWVFKVKRNADNSISRFKARLVAQGFSQEAGTDFDEVFAPVVRYSTIRLLLALAAVYNLEVDQLDVKTAFLNGELDYEIYLKQPECYVDPDNPDYVCKLKRGLYGLKQSARIWYQALDRHLQANGYRQCPADPCVYIKRRDDGVYVIISVYVDDLLTLSVSRVVLDQEKAQLSKKFEMVDQGEAHYVLGISIKRDRQNRSLVLSHHKYLEGIVKRFELLDCNPVGTPMESNQKFRKLEDGDECADKITYQAAIGCLTYATITTRPDLATSVGILSQHMANPGKDHWLGVKRILRYLKGTLDFGLRFGGLHCDATLVGYSDANWAGDLDDRISTSGYVFLVGDGCISWRSKKQRCVAKSSTEAEYVALSTATSECIWLRRLLGDLGFVQSSATTMYEDNQGAIALSRNPKDHERTKHIDIAYHFARERQMNGEINVIYCPTAEMLADVMTKALPRPMFEKLREAIGVCKT
jgi:transposase InsO family protein